MGGAEGATTSSKAEKASSAVQEQSGVQQFPDWAAMQAYYGPGIAMPPHYFGTTTVASGHAPHHPYMWSPQPMMPPFGTPYPAIYPHGGVYPHPSSPLTAPTQEKATKTTNNNKDNVQTKKLKGPDGLAVSASNGRDKNELGGASHTRSQSTDDGTDGSSDGSDGNNSRRKLFLEDSAAVNAAGVTTTAIRALPAPVSASAKVKMAGPVALSNNAVPPGLNGMHSELWVQDERELKRERRKQSNRESARRSRLRKQAETEELAEKVEALKAENLALRTEISRLSENSAKLRQENAVLLDKLSHTQAGQKLDSGPAKGQPEAPGSPQGETENLITKINDANSACREKEQPARETRESGGKLQQLLDSAEPQAEAAIAG
ncbi:G-box-binding factor 3-like [Wolffia australiana]